MLLVLFYPGVFLQAMCCVCSVCAVPRPVDPVHLAKEGQSGVGSDSQHAMSIDLCIGCLTMGWGILWGPKLERDFLFNCGDKVNCCPLLHRVPNSTRQLFRVGSLVQGMFYVSKRGLEANDVYIDSAILGSPQ